MQQQREGSQSPGGGDGDGGMGGGWYTEETHTLSRSRSWFLAVITYMCSVRVRGCNIASLVYRSFTYVGRKIWKRTYIRENQGSDQIIFFINSSMFLSQLLTGRIDEPCFMYSHWCKLRVKTREYEYSSIHKFSVHLFYCRYFCESLILTFCPPANHWIFFQFAWT